MKLLVDANLSPGLIKSLGKDFPESIHVFSLGIEGDDNLIWDYAVQHGFILLSKDSDFYHRSRQAKNSPKIIWFKKRNCSTSEVLSLIGTLDIESFVRSEKFKCLIVS